MGKSYNGIQPVDHNVVFKLNISIDSKEDLQVKRKIRDSFQN
jgi:hypothetical protein